MGPLTNPCGGEALLPFRGSFYVPVAPLERRNAQKPVGSVAVERYCALGIGLVVGGAVPECGEDLGLAPPVLVIRPACCRCCHATVGAFRTRTRCRPPVPAVTMRSQPVPLGASAGKRRCFCGRRNVPGARTRRFSDARSLSCRRRRVSCGVSGAWTPEKKKATLARRRRRGQCRRRVLSVSLALRRGWARPQSLPFACDAGSPPSTRAGASVPAPRARARRGSVREAASGRALPISRVLS